MIEKEALEYLSELAQEAASKKIIKTEAGIEYSIDGQGDLTQLRPSNGVRNALALHTLSGVVDYVKNNAERQTARLILHIVNETHVELLNSLDQYDNRETLIKSDAIVPDISFDNFIAAEQLIIILQSQFVNTSDREILMKVLGNLKEENVKNASDDGVSQAVTVKTGVASAGDVRVPNPVELQPYRTFAEIEQPTSKFIFRMHDGMRGALIESDGGYWRNDAIQRIKEYFEKELKTEIGSKYIRIIA
ncbi:hypothetical protein M3M33_05165 [Loigolactobacillus coryniformis]|uniref:hypothetical protein n=1 Tax=Loigolactobacillus coryniformis TaxID=1610 RepID=UPI00201A922E|nr:hypothetical protein [Loigolactobacillus coryniformis]MCL5458062.1 hypothetical protein [Loigolactobacillus coryniformis]